MDPTVIQVINGSPIALSPAIREFIKPGNNLRAFLVARASYESDRNASMMKAFGASGRLSALPFCPIDAGNLVTLSIRFTKFEHHPDDNNLPSGSEASSVPVLPVLVGLELTIVLGKENTMLAAAASAAPNDDPFVWMAAVSG